MGKYFCNLMYAEVNVNVALPKSAGFYNFPVLSQSVVVTTARTKSTEIASQSFK